MSRLAMVLFAVSLTGSRAASVKVQHRQAEVSTVAAVEHRQRSQISMAAVMSGHAHAPAPAAATTPAAAPPAESIEAKHEASGPPKLPEQGYEGKDVRHENYKTATADFGSEYGPTTQPPVFRGSASSTFTVALATLVLAAQAM
mmetsp:Transcript_94748/g.149890  ORF Transcript_94748/g.149890 Transcript_94748/m.149890 type:complete len:144 (+) Transcript_94748:64-495(+)|eukprot:CAMPEP_0169117026 /NCGR_PEP_ID=MMETSP1015-20121227/30227_1 /TAXON_ID=342587 /ORGANISM="Karlodinium micrum, Strain CCMP2283" /LENGTH=143 /DNA_ID=CAMNT_0009179659 /DNA_START=59 /DNA_END=490 /DNA_ORIENTATION=+